MMRITLKNKNSLIIWINFLLLDKFFNLKIFQFYPNTKIASFVHSLLKKISDTRNYCVRNNFVTFE